MQNCSCCTKFTSKSRHRILSKGCLQAFLGPETTKSWPAFWYLVEGAEVGYVIWLPWDQSPAVPSSPRPRIVPLGSYRAPLAMFLPRRRWQGPALPPYLHPGHPFVLGPVPPLGIKEQAAAFLIASGAPKAVPTFGQGACRPRPGARDTAAGEPHG